MGKSYVVTSIASPRIPLQKYSLWDAIQRCVFIMAAKALLLFNYRQISCKIQPPTGRNSCRSSCWGGRARGGEPRWASSSSSASFAPGLRGSRQTHPGGPSRPGGLSSAGPVLGEAQQRWQPWQRAWGSSARNWNNLYFII